MLRPNQSSAQRARRLAAAARHVIQPSIATVAFLESPPGWQATPCSKSWSVYGAAAQHVSCDPHFGPCPPAIGHRLSHAGGGRLRTPVCRNVPRVECACGQKTVWGRPTFVTFDAHQWSEHRVKPGNIGRPCWVMAGSAERSGRTIAHTRVIIMGKMVLPWHRPCLTPLFRYVE